MKILVTVKLTNKLKTINNKNIKEIWIMQAATTAHPLI